MKTTYKELDQMSKYGYDKCNQEWIEKIQKNIDELKEKQTHLLNTWPNYNSQIAILESLLPGKEKP